MTMAMKKMMTMTMMMMILTIVIMMTMMTMTMTKTTVAGQLLGSEEVGIIHLELLPIGSLIEERIQYNDRLLQRKRRRRRRRIQQEQRKRLRTTSLRFDDENMTTTEVAAAITIPIQRRRPMRPLSDDVEATTTIEEEDNYETDDDDDDDGDDRSSFVPPAEWFHPYSRGVYATIHPPSVLSSYLSSSSSSWDAEDDMDEDFDTVTTTSAIDDATIIAAYEDFIQYRHLSRYERQYRIEMGYNLYPHWDGNYSATATTTLIHNSTTRTKRNTSATVNTNVTNTTNQKRQPQSEQHRRHHYRRNVLESLMGGKFDNYQGVPLSQGYGTHYVHLWVGKPTPQRQSVIVDTGSHFTGFPVVGCVGCGERHHTDPHFDPTLSQTFQTLTCPNECVDTYHCDTTTTTTTTKKIAAPTPATSTNTRTTTFDNNEDHPTTTATINTQQQQPQETFSSSSSSSSTTTTLSPTTQTASITTTTTKTIASRCMIQQAYTEGSSWTAYQGQDIVYCGGGTDVMDAVDPTDVKYEIPFIFGCLQHNTGLFVTQLADGIMGMSAHELTLPKQLYNAGKIEYNMFAMCFRKELGTSKRGVTAGSMTLGGVSSALDTSPMVYAKNIGTVYKSKETCQ
jgi:hypothetical protein